MKDESPEKKLDEQLIKEAAEAALSDLQLDAGVKSVAASGEEWRVQFTADYGQFSDSFQDRFGKENGFELIREKIKRHILKQQQNKIRAGVRIRRGKPERPRPTENLLESAVKTIGEVASQTAAFAGEIISQAISLPETALTALETAGETVIEGAGSAVETISQTATRVAQRPLARVRVKVAAAKETAKTPRPARPATSKKTPARKKAATKSSKRSTAKLASKSKSKPIKKSAAKSSKSTAKPAAKKSRTGKSPARKNARKR
ncbi:MAG: hypothetical protein QOF02_2312 [Blastocatellia bacterium]|jgi:hypothetical protein|nr:hypothetical protein [Blastocatellia bacterium]